MRVVSSEESFRQININNIKMILILATIFLIIALIQKLKPTFSITYQINKPSYIKGKLIAKLITSVTLYICGFYLYYFTDLTQTSKYTFWALSIPFLLYHVYKWGFSKLIDYNNKNKKDKREDIYKH